ncbi:hypothetical protein GGC64_000954 [Mycobacterium sp. OAS707]|nr:hypothetical protein [Mycobacterium sp. OAS707]
MFGQEKTPVSWPLYEGRALMLVLCPAEGKRGINALPNYYEQCQGLHNRRP